MHAVDRSQMNILKSLVFLLNTLTVIFTIGCDKNLPKTMINTEEYTANAIKLQVTYPATSLSGAPLNITVRLNNFGSTPVNISSIRNNKKLLIEMTNLKGERVEMSRFGNESEFSLSTHRTDPRKIVETLSPGDYWQWHINLSEIFMLHPNVYHLNVSAFINEDDMTKVFSVKVKNLPIRIH